MPGDRSGPCASWGRSRFGTHLAGPFPTEPVLNLPPTVTMAQVSIAEAKLAPIEHIESAPNRAERRTDVPLGRVSIGGGRRLAVAAQEHRTIDRDGSGLRRPGILCRSMAKVVGAEAAERLSRSHGSHWRE